MNLKRMLFAVSALFVMSIPVVAQPCISASVERCQNVPEPSTLPAFVYPPSRLYYARRVRNADNNINAAKRRIRRNRRKQNGNRRTR